MHQHTDYHPGQLMNTASQMRNSGKEKQWNDAMRSTGSIKVSDILAAMPTQEVQSVRPRQKSKALHRLTLERDRSTKPLLPLDSQGRPYVLMINPGASTADLIVEAVERYIWYTGQSPTTILLSLPRYFAIEAKGYRVNGRVIFFDCSGLRDYDVLVR
jgi:hypothetical protein